MQQQTQLPQQYTAEDAYQKNPTNGDLSDFKWCLIAKLKLMHMANRRFKKCDDISIHFDTDHSVMERHAVRTF